MPIEFVCYGPGFRSACLGLFDANCPASFAPNERAGYAAFLDRAGDAYRVAVRDGRALAAFGLVPSTGARSHLNWILVDPAAQGTGAGRAMMAEAARLARASGTNVIDIAASHLSAPFFARFGAVEVGWTQDGWGPGMHRVDMFWTPARDAADR